MTTVLDQDTFATGGRGTPNAISPGSNGTNWLRISGSTPTVSMVGSVGQFTGVSSVTVWQLGTGTAADADTVVRFQVSATGDSFGVFLRQQATNTYYLAKVVATQVQIHKLIAGVDTTLLSPLFTLSAATLYWMRFRVVGITLYVKIWADSVTEPDAWTGTTTDSSIVGAGGWGVRVSPNLTTDTVQLDSYQVNQVFSLTSETIEKFSIVPRITVPSRMTFKTQIRPLTTKSVNKFIVSGSSVVIKAPDNPYGHTAGLNIGAPPFSSGQFLSQQVVNWVKGMGMAWFRIQMSAWQIWYTHSDPVANWHWEAIDDAIYKIKQAGLFCSFPLRFVNPQDGSGILAADGIRYAHYNTIQSTSGVVTHMMPNPPDVATFASAVANRYNGVNDVISTPSGGVPINYGKLKLDMIEIGNEEFNLYFAPPATPPNIFGQYNDPITFYNAFTIGVTAPTRRQPARSPHWLVPCLIAAYPVIKAANPQCLVAAASIWDVRPGNAAAFTAGLYTDVVGNAKGYFDITNAHLYTNGTLPNVGSTQCITIDQLISDIDAAMTAQNDNSKLMISEIGWNADQLTTSSTTVAAGAGTITVANPNGAAVGGTMLVDTVASGHQETVTLTSVSGSVLGATFANPHSGTNYPITIYQDCSEAQQSANYSYCLNAAMNSKRVSKFFIYTIDDSTTPQTSSIIQYGYNGAVGYHFMTAYTTIVNFITTNPTWNQAAIIANAVPVMFSGVDGTVTFTGVDGIDTFSGIG